jgi:hypothetical protein
VLNKGDKILGSKTPFSGGKGLGSINSLLYFLSCIALHCIVLTVRSKNTGRWLGWTRKVTAYNKLPYNACGQLMRTCCINKSVPMCTE